MGSGKSTIGTGLAARLGVPFHDNDHLLALRTGRTARAIEDDEGLDALHRFEAAVLVAALDDPRPSVIAAAAGAVLEPEVAAALAAHDVVYLSVSPAVIATRLAREPDDGHRPHLDIAALFAARDATYRQLADMIVDAEQAPELVVDDIIRLLPRS